ncbi:MAG: 2-succinyl-5-enolpyruvyl-6-hydroxy-3-cyclohexene-1-carboxylate synthase, partial [Candidatus Latescibacterota bacterium]
SWTEDFAAADGAVWKTFDDARRPDAPLEKSAVARAILSSLPEGSLLAIGNSLPVREIDSFCPGWLADVPVWSQKGANGIDGLVSGAAGAAMAHGGPATAYIGDLAFLHDLHGLAAARRIETPFVVVVAQNDGGRIFEQIPIAEAPGVENGMLALWTTPHGLDLAHAALLFNLGYRRVESESALREALLEAHGTNGCTIIEAVVPPSGALAEHRRFVEAVAERLPAEGKAEP